VTDTATLPEVEPELTPPVGKHRLHEPGGRGGLVEVIRSRTIVQMLVRRDVRLKYRYSSIGYMWGYVKPSIQFCVYYFIIGVVLGIDRRVENFAVYVFSGLCLLHFFNETISNGARSIVKNRAIIKKVWLPREIFPIAGMMVAAARFLPQFIILMIGATATGWYFTWEGLLAAIAGLAIVSVWGISFGLIIAALNVYIREITNVLELTGFLTHWLTPMIKPWSLVQERTAGLGITGSIIMAAYIYNPLCTAVELFHLAFWMPTVDFYFELSPNLWTRAWVMIVIGLGVLVLAQRFFRRLQANFADAL
jgi:ABC-2 type transport system permease protein